MNRLKTNASTILISIMFFAGVFVASFGKIPVRNIMKNYSYDVLVILIIMELFTGLIASTGIMQKIAVKIVSFAEGKKRPCLIMFGAMMFIISACLNNITAVMMILPVIFVFMKALEVDEKFVCTFFAVILALSNTGGAASPIGDFPAIIIMTSGITTFLSYLWRAVLLFSITSAALLCLWSRKIEKENINSETRTLAILNLKSQYKNRITRNDVLAGLGIIFALMFIAWSFIKPDILPPEIVAVLGFSAAMFFCIIKGLKINMMMDLKSLLTIASFVFFAEAVSQTGLLKIMAAWLQSNIQNPKILVSVIMIITSAVAGIFSAGPAAAAMMPVIIELCNGVLRAQSDWIAIAYAASICAGSSLFLWSATAGFILSGKINDAHIENDKGSGIFWGVGKYFKYGLVNYLVQMSVALAVVNVVL